MIVRDLPLVARQSLTTDLSRLYAALLSVGRREDAVEVGELLVRTLDTPETRLVLVSTGASAAKGPEEGLDRWLAEAAAAGANVKLVHRKLERLAEGKAGASGD